MSTAAVTMPRLGVNDDSIILTEWLIKNGEKVEKGQQIASIETTKEASEINAPESGYLYIKVKAGQEVKVGADIAIISTEPMTEDMQQTAQDKSNGMEGLRMTEKARQLIQEYKIDVSLLPKDKMIREKDVLPYVSLPYEISETKFNQYIVYGGGGLGKMAIEIINQTPGISAAGVIDSNYPNRKETLGIPVIGNDDSLEQVRKDGYQNVINCIAFYRQGHWRKPTYELLKKYGFSFPNLIHKTAIVEPTVTMGEGNLIFAGASIGSEVKIGSNCIINAGAIISHDCIISDHCHIASGATLAGRVTVGTNTLIGQNCSIYFDVKIGKNVVIQNGCHIFKNVPDDTVVTLDT